MGSARATDPFTPLQDVSLDVSRGDVLGLIGENGAGKSTLIGVLTGTVRPDAGSLDVNGTHVELGDSRTLRELGISVVVQEQSLVDALRVYENIYLGREGEIGGWGPGRRRRMRDAAQSLLDTLGIEGLRADAVVAELTYPQRQLVEIARAFSRITDATEAPVILLDEPTSALTETEVEILFALIEGWRDRVSFIFVSHILQDVLRISTRLLVLRDGRSIETLSADGVTAEQLHELMVGSERSADYYREGEQTGVLSTKPLIELRDASSAGEFESVDLVVRTGRGSGTGRSHRFGESVGGCSSRGCGVVVGGFDSRRRYCARALVGSRCRGSRSLVRPAGACPGLPVPQRVDQKQHLDRLPRSPPPPVDAATAFTDRKGTDDAVSPRAAGQGPVVVDAHRGTQWRKPTEGDLRSVARSRMQSAGPQRSDAWNRRRNARGDLRFGPVDGCIGGRCAAVRRIPRRSDRMSDRIVVMKDGVISAELRPLQSTSPPKST